jgi:hypothetical protein
VQLRGAELSIGLLQVRILSSVEGADSRFSDMVAYREERRKPGFNDTRKPDLSQDQVYPNSGGYPSVKAAVIRRSLRTLALGRGLTRRGVLGAPSGNRVHLPVGKCPLLDVSAVVNPATIWRVRLSINTIALSRLSNFPILSSC